MDGRRSRARRQIDAANGIAITGAVQTDAVLDSGGSGGPPIDVDGRVPGIPTRIANEGGRNEGVGSAARAATSGRHREADACGPATSSPPPPTLAGRRPGERIRVEARREGRGVSAEVVLGPAGRRPAQAVTSRMAPVRMS